MAAGAIAPGYYKNVTPLRRSYSLALTWQFLYTNKYPDTVSRIMQEAGESIAYGLELDLTHPFTFGTATTYTDRDGRTVDISSGDGLALFYALHTLTNSSTTYRNILAGNPQLSAGALEAAENILNQQIYDNSGNRRPMRADTLVTASDATTYHVAIKLARSTAQLDAPNAGVVNVYQGKYRVVQAMWLDSTATGVVDTTKSKYWMLVNTRVPGAYLYVLENPTVTMPTEANGGLDFFTENRTAKATAMYEPVVLDPRAYIFSDGLGTA
jgi:hypothetical protein